MGRRERPVTKAEQAVLERLERLTARLPEVVVECDGFGHSVLKVGKRSSVIVDNGDGERPTVSIKSDPVTQDLLVRGGAFERAAFIGQHGWVTARGRPPELPWRTIEGLVEDAWCLAAPRRLVRNLAREG